MGRFRFNTLLISVKLGAWAGLGLVLYLLVFTYWKKFVYLFFSYISDVSRESELSFSLYIRTVDNSKDKTISDGNNTSDGAEFIGSVNVAPDFSSQVII